ncbi:chaperone NapD [Parasedimentitalea psychrophila]|uniref:Chaperone NapD n=1 Tax=Parasedimentitalea psychrophila TaxID=2997337 RepID=A0A9Y2KYP2_9RHOB|nr:chaperone NapD [Parasedimentitalea psychrophila]WIY25565.1 chaperone NapD [Parasedimentitalea psychrophila]
MTEVVHISSLLLRADPQKFEQILAEIAKIELAEVPMTDPSGKIIVTLETENQSNIVEALTQLQLLDGVVSASLVYHQTD